jgi:hypothetical protein
MQIHQLSFSHDREQDRILVRINSTTADEFRLWLTRRLSIQLLPLLDKVLSDQLAKSGATGTSHLIGADEQTKRMMAEFQSSDALKEADFSTPYDDSARNLPLGPDPLLVTEISFKPLRADLLEALFSEGSKGSRAAGQAGEPRQLRLNLDLRLAHSFIHMLRNCFVKAQWGDSTVTASGASATPAQDLAGAKPRYLN